PEAWRTDGMAFGERALRPGEARFAGTPERPRIEVIDRAAAYRDPAWQAIRADAGDQRDHGRLGEWERAGQSIRTPEFVLQSGVLWYLVKGAVRAYANVHSHLLIAGPLHAALLAEWKGDDEWHWVRHDLSAYQGHRLHVELSPTGPGDVAIAQVV